MATKNDVIINVIADTKKAVAGMAKFAIGIGAAVVVARKMIQVGADMVNAFGEQEKAETRLSAAIRATGREQEMSTDRLGALASSLQKVTTFGDEATLSAMAMTQQLANLDQEGLEKVTPGILDFAAAMDIDLNTAANLIGKTLGSSTNALTRYGVEIDMTGTETEKLASLTQALNDKFGGTAKALAETTLGGMEQFKNAVGDLKEAGGEMIAGFLSPTISRLTNLATKANEAIAASKAFKNAFKDAGGGTTAADLIAVNEQLFTKYKGNLEAVIGLSRELPYDQIAATLVEIAKSEELSLDFVSETAIEMGVITQEALNQSVAYKVLVMQQAQAATWADRTARANKIAADEGKRLAEVSTLATTQAELIAQYTEDFFPQAPLTRLEEAEAAFASITEQIALMDTLGGDLGPLGAIRNMLRDLIPTLKVLETHDEASLGIIAPLLGLGSQGMINSNLRSNTMGYKIQQTALEGLNKTIELLTAQRDSDSMPELIFPKLDMGELNQTILGFTDLEKAMLGASVSATENATATAAAMSAYDEAARTERNMRFITDALDALVAKQNEYTAAVEEAIIVQEYYGNAAADYMNQVQGLADPEPFEKLKEVTDKLGESLKQTFGRETLEMLEGFGAAMMSGSSGAEMAAQSVEDFAKAILDNLPTLLFQAGLALAGVNPGLAAGLIIASGIAAVVKGAVNAEPTGGGSNTVTGKTVNNYTYAPSIAGSMLVERDVNNKLLTSSAGTNRGY